MIDPRVACSSISFRKRPLTDALAVMAKLGFRSFDLGALPGVCDHVPYELDAAAVAEVSTIVQDSALRPLSINADIGDLNRPLTPAESRERAAHLERLLDLCEATGAPAVVLPCGSLGQVAIVELDADLDLVAAELTNAADRAAGRGIQLWVEVLHSGRLCHNLARARQLRSRLAESGVGLVMDFSHIVATGDDPLQFIDAFFPNITHVHIRDARPGDINVSVGNGEVDFASGIAELIGRGYQGAFSLELETRDITEAERPAAAGQAAEYISTLIREAS